MTNRHEVEADHLRLLLKKELAKVERAKEYILIHVPEQLHGCAMDFIDKAESYKKIEPPISSDR